MGAVASILYAAKVDTGEGSQSPGLVYLPCCFQLSGEFTRLYSNRLVQPSESYFSRMEYKQAHPSLLVFNFWTRVTRKDKTGQDKARQDKTRRDKTRRDETRQDFIRVSPLRTFIRLYRTMH